MITTTTEIRVRYVETDKMQIAHHASYVAWLEVARIAMLDDIGLPYREIEAAGLRLPVLELAIQYKAPAYFDDCLTIHSDAAMPSLVRVKINNRITRGSNLIATATTTLVFVNEQGAPVKVPAFFLEPMKKVARPAKVE